MIYYVTLGAHDVKAAKGFYDKVLKPLGYGVVKTEEYGIGYGPKGGPSSVWVMKPHDKRPASFGNGTMVCLHAPSRKAVDEFHAAALAAGGVDEGAPGIRGGDGSNWYACYVRDLTGNKLSAVYDKPV